jgi:hypothetical protein
MLRVLVLPALLLALAVPVATGASPAFHAHLKTTLTGGNEVGGGDPDSGGSATITLNRTKRTVCWSITFRGGDNAVAAHIHVGGRTVVGGVVVPLGSSFAPKGCVKTAKATITKIGTHPGAYYVNVHTTSFPGGAARGQLHA